MLDDVVRTGASALGVVIVVVGAGAVVALTACGQFFGFGSDDDDDPSPSSSGGPSPTTPDGATTTDANAGSDGSSSSGELDSGAVSDTSVDTGSPFATDPFNCGVPGHRCPTNNCTNGVCDLAVFVTSATWNGALGGDGTPANMGFNAGDNRCQELAAANVKRPVRAWLSDSTANVVARIPATAGPYRLLDGKLVTESIGKLAMDGPKIPINLDEVGNPQIGLVWTGTNGTNAATAANRCADWTSGVAQNTNGNHGLIGGIGLTWTEQDVAPCSEPMHLYCFELP